MDRREQIELLDDPTLPDATVARAYRALNHTHRFLGNTGAILRLLRNDPLPIRKVLDIGCGQGALLEEIRQRMRVEVVGFDLRPAPQSSSVPILLGDAVADPLPKADVAIAMCMTHHLSENEIIGLIRNVARSSRRFLILDLVRHPLPLVLFRTFVCPFLPPINVTDGITSIRRSYTPMELRKIIDAAVLGSEARVAHRVAPCNIRQTIDIRW